MSVTATATGPLTLEPEWERIEVLARCLMHARQGSEIPDQLIEKLQSLQQEVHDLRHADGPWRALGINGLGSLEIDILACTLAPEAQPGIGWLYQSLQPGTPQPYASIALMQSLLALEGAEVRRFRETVRLVVAEPSQAAVSHAGA